jgi:dTDP-4-amino-4,6-dideoxygalactose transaminase
VYRDAYSEVTLPVAETAANEVLSLPIWPSIEPGVQERVASALGAAAD